MFKFFTQKQWFLWSILGSIFILISTWYQVQLDVKINEWFGEFYDTLQKALTTPNSVTECEKYTDCDCITVDWGAVEPDGAYIRVVENLPEKLVLEENELDDTETDFEIATYTITTINDGNGIEIRYSIDNYIDIDTYTRVSDFCE